METSVSLTKPKKMTVSRETFLNLIVPEGKALEALPPREQSHFRAEMANLTDEDIDKAFTRIPS